MEGAHESTVLWWHPRSLLFKLTWFENLNVRRLFNNFSPKWRKDLRRKKLTSALSRSNSLTRAAKVNLYYVIKYWSRSWNLWEDLPTYRGSAASICVAFISVQIYYLRQEQIVFFLKIGPFPASFISLFLSFQYSLFNTADSKYNCRWLDSKHGSLVLESIIQPTLQQPLPKNK